MNKPVKDNKWTSDQLLCYNLIPALCYCTKYFPFYSTWSILLFFPFNSWNWRHFTSEIGFWFNQVLLKTYLTVCIKGKDNQRENITTSCHSQKDCTSDTPILQSTLHITISSVPTLFFCNSTTISEKNPHMTRLYYTVHCQNPGF